MLEAFLKKEKFTKEEIELLEYIYKEELGNKKDKKSKFSAQMKVIQEAKDILKKKYIKENVKREGNNKISIGSVLVEITDEKIDTPNVEFSTKIKEAMYEEYIRDLMVYSDEFVDLLRRSDMEKQFVTIYTNYKE
jgi:hypothetical protein